MKFIPTSLPDAYLVELDKKKDSRGFFARAFCEDEFLNAGLESKFIQQNISESRERNTLRGMHYQVGKDSEVKYIRCHKGAIKDVIVDIRKDSSTFMSYEAFELNEKNYLALYVPRGFAHGFITLTENVVVSYLVSSCYSSENERAFRWNDNAFNINWPTNSPNISERDSSHKDFDLDKHALNSDFLEIG